MSSPHVPLTSFWRAPPPPSPLSPKRVLVPANLIQFLLLLLIQRLDEFGFPFSAAPEIKGFKNFSFNSKMQRVQHLYLIPGQERRKGQRGQGKSLSSGRLKKIFLILDSLSRLDGRNVSWACPVLFGLWWLVSAFDIIKTFWYLSHTGNNEQVEKLK